MANQINLVVRAKDAASATLEKVRKRSDELGTSAGGLAGKLKGLGSSLVTVGKVAAVGLTGLAVAAAAALPSVLNLAGKIELMGKKAKVVFGDQLRLVETWAAKSAAKMGLTQKAAVGLAANFGDLLVPMGFTREQAAKMSTEVVGLSGALSQWSGGTRSAAEVSEILAKAMLGERESLKELGISINDADVDARVLKMGMQDLTGAQMEQARATATQQLIFEKSKDAQDAYATSSGGLLSQQAQLGAKFAQVGESIAIGLTPFLSGLMTFVSETAIPRVGEFIGKIQTWFAENKPLIDQLSAFASGVLKTLFEAIGNILTRLGEVIAWITGNKAIMAALRTSWQLIADVIGVIVQGLRDIIRLAERAVGWLQRVIKEQNIGNNPGGAPVFFGPGEIFGPPKPKQAGGWVGLHGPELILGGERGPEYMLSNEQVRRGRVPDMGGGPTVIHTKIYLDGREIAEVVDRHQYRDLRRAVPTAGRI